MALMSVPGEKRQPFRIGDRKNVFFTEKLWREARHRHEGLSGRHSGGRKTVGDTIDSRGRGFTRRDFLKAAGAGTAALALPRCRAPGPGREDRVRQPHLIYVLADQWRAQAAGYAGDPNALTPNLDALAGESADFVNAVSGCPVCSPYRASLMTGQHPLTHGVFLNDVCLGPESVSLAEAYAQAGYDTAFIGKWHLDGHGRSAYIPRERRHGFDTFKVLECTHDYNESAYYAGDDRQKRYWRGYDAAAQTRDAERYIREHAGSTKPFFLVLSWGPPHNPYQTAPDEFRRMFRPESIELRPNVPPGAREKAREDLAGYYAHIAALDHYLGDLLRTLRETGLDDDTILVFTSDHGDMLGSQGRQKKQKPWDESILVPFLIRYPQLLGKTGLIVDSPISTPDIMPTLLGLSGIPVPGTVEGIDRSGILLGSGGPKSDAALLSCVSPFGEWSRKNGREYRGIRTRRYTFVRDLDGPWLLYDNLADPYQMNNLVDRPDCADLQSRLDAVLCTKLDERGDAFLGGESYIEKWGYEVDETGTVPYEH